MGYLAPLSAGIPSEDGHLILLRTPGLGTKLVIKEVDNTWLSNDG